MYVIVVVRKQCHKMFKVEKHTHTPPTNVRFFFQMSESLNNETSP